MITFAAALPAAFLSPSPTPGVMLGPAEGTGDQDVSTSSIQKGMIYAHNKVGMFAQITSAFATAGRSTDGEPNIKMGEGLTAVLCPHRKIKIAELVKLISPLPEFAGCCGSRGGK